MVSLNLFGAGPARASPTLILFRTANDQAEQKREKRFLDELRLALDDFRVLVIEPGKPGFASLSMGQQIRLIRTLLRKKPAVAAVWLNQPAGDLLLLHLVSVSTGRALVRIVEGKPGKGSEAKLALAARELLGAAYMFAPRKTKKQKAIARVVARVRRQVAPPARAKAKGRWVIFAGSSLLVGLVGQVGARLAAGGCVEVEVRLAGRWYGRIGLSALATGLGSIEGADGDSWRLDPGLGLFRGFKVGPTELGISAGVRFGFNSITWSLDSLQDFEHRWMDVRFVLGAGLRFSLYRGLGMYVAVVLQGAPRRRVFYRQSTEKELWTTAWLSSGVSLGLRFHLP